MAYFKKSGTKWQAQISWYDSDNKRQHKTKSGFDTKPQALKWANEIEVTKYNNQITNKDPIFAEYFLEWANTYKKTGTSNNIKNRYKTIYKLLLDYFGKLKVTKITKLKYQEFINYYGKDRVKDTVKKTDGSIRSCVKDAISEGIISKNLTDRLKLTWNDERTIKVEYLEFNQIKSHKNSLLKDIKPNYISRYMLLTIIYTCMRPGEIRVLTWNNIDFKHLEIHITKSWDYDNNKIIDYDSNEINKETKNKTSTRVIKVDQKLLDILNQLKANNHERLFIDELGTIPSSSAVNKVLRKQLDILGIKKKGFHFHSLKHTHVALLLFKGIDLYSISKRLRHSNMSITANTYAYMLDELKQKSDNQIIEVLDEI